MAAIYRERAEDIRTVMKRHREAGGWVYLLTLTVPHQVFDALRGTRRGVAEAWRKVVAGKAWRDAQQSLGAVGSVRAVEVTIGQHGFHPHLHVLMFTRSELPLEVTDREARSIAKDAGFSPESVAGLRVWLWNRWTKRVVKLGFKEPSFEHGVSVDGANRAARYLAKMGLADELTGLHAKQGRHGNRTPLQLLSDCGARGRPYDRALWQEYCEAMHGAKQLTWSRGLRELYNLGNERPDEEVAKDLPACPPDAILDIEGTVFASSLRGKPDALRDLELAAEQGNVARIAGLLGNEKGWSFWVLEKSAPYAPHEKPLYFDQSTGEVMPDAIWARLFAAPKRTKRREVDKLEPGITIEHHVQNEELRSARRVVPHIVKRQGRFTVEFEHEEHSLPE